MNSLLALPVQLSSNPSVIGPNAAPQAVAATTDRGLSLFELLVQGLAAPPATVHSDASSLPANPAPVRTAGIDASKAAPLPDTGITLRAPAILRTTPEPTTSAPRPIRTRQITAHAEKVQGDEASAVPILAPTALPAAALLVLPTLAAAPTNEQDRAAAIAKPEEAAHLLEQLVPTDAVLNIHLRASETAVRAVPFTPSLATSSANSLPFAHPKDSPKSSEKPSGSLAPVAPTQARPESLARDTGKGTSDSHQQRDREQIFRLTAGSGINTESIATAPPKPTTEPVPDGTTRLASPMPAIQPHLTETALPDRPSASSATSPHSLHEPPPAPADTAQPLRHVALEFAPEGAGDVRLRVSERAGEVHISVHSSDPALSDRLQDGVHELVGSLSTAGYDAEAWTRNQGRQNPRQPDDTPKKRAAIPATEGAEAFGALLPQTVKEIA